MGGQRNISRDKGKTSNVNGKGCTFSALEASIWKERWKERKRDNRVF